MNDLSERIVDLSPEKLGRLIARLRNRSTAAEAPDRITPREEPSDTSLLSFGQQRLWFLDRFQPGTALYNTFALFRLAGPLQVAAWEQSLAEIRRRHEILRTTFSTSGEQPVQVVSGPQPLLLDQVDLSGICGGVGQMMARSLAVAETHRPFDLEAGPLIRISLVRLSSRDHVVLFTIHHIIFDGWSVSPLIQELATLYRAFLQGKPSPLGPLPIQYADFVDWQRRWLRGQLIESQLAYWKQQLAGAPAFIELPADRPRPPAQTSHGALEREMFPEQTIKPLNALIREENATLFIGLLSAIQVLLSGYSGETDVCVGSPIANRNRPELEGLIGFFVNTLVMRADLSGRASFRQVMRRMRDVALEAYAHQDIPFEYLVEALQPGRRLSHTPFFQVMVTLQNAPMGSPELEGLTIRPWEIDSLTAKFDLHFILRETESGLAVTIQYNTDLFDAVTVTRTLSHLESVLRRVSAEPDRAVATILLLNDGQLHQVSIEWNDTARRYQSGGIADLIERQVERRRDSVAVVFGEHQVSYGELNARGNQLARHLKRLGAGQEQLVGVCVERSIEMIVGMIGILKAGAAYVPLDPSYPYERLALMIADADIRLLLTQERFVPALPECNAEQVRLDSDWDEVARNSDSGPAITIAPDNLAYVIYTSGSTGRPKGVQATHRGVLRLLLGVDYVHLDEEETVLQAASASFDACTFEVWAPLLHGGRCVLFPDRTPTPQELRLIIREQGVTTMWLTSSLFNVVISEDGAALAGLRQLLIGGEALSPAHVRRARALLPDTRVINGYGPTEGTTFTCCYRIEGCVESGQESIPIGSPISNTTAHLLDGNLLSVPVGVVGELHVGGDGLARGYLNGPDATAEKFIPDHFSGMAGARLYKTGDLSRLRREGCLDFLRRKDRQVKVRGFRVELGEIEAILSCHPDIKEAVVVVCEEKPAEKRLVGYVVPEDQKELQGEQLRAYLGKRLPEHMAPSLFVVLGALPLNRNGKTDRRALEQLRLEAPIVTEYVAPRDVEEQVLASIWSQLLGKEKVGVHDNFFELGGHSLLAAQVMSRAAKAFHIELPLRNLFESPTIAEMAAQIRSLKDTQQQVSAKLAQALQLVGSLSQEETAALLREKQAGSQRPATMESAVEIG